MKFARPFSIVVMTLFLALNMLAAEDGAPVRVGISVRVVDQDDKVVDKAKVVIKSDLEQGVAATAETFEGIAAKNLAPGSYSVTVNSAGFSEVIEEHVQVRPGEVTEVHVTLHPAADKQQITISGTADEVAMEKSASQAEVKREEVKNLPSHPATVADVLPLIPGVVRGPDGFMEISGAAEDRSALLVNSADVTDPGTGQFGPTIPIDSVEAVGVAKTPYLAQYGRFTAGVVSVTTRRGGDKWHFELNDPLPEFRIRSLHLRGLKSMSPRFSVNGPLIKDRLFFAEGFEFNLNKSAVRTLPFPYNETRRRSVNSFTQLDLILSPKHVMTFTGHVVPGEVTHANLGYFNPQPVTPNIDSQDMTFAVNDRLELGAGVLQTSVNLRLAHVETFGTSAGGMLLTPEGNRGSYFARNLRRSNRTDLAENFALNPLQAGGSHNLQVGGSYSQSSTHGRFVGQSVRIYDSAKNLLQQVDFSSDSKFSRQNSEFTAYVQDHWIVTPKLAFDAGIRWEGQTISKSSRLAPRGGFTWTPLASQHTVVRGGAGVFYERIPLNTYAFNSYPEQSITLFDGSTVSDGPRRFINEVFLGGFPQGGVGGRRRRALPRSIGWSVEVEQFVSQMLRFRVGYLQNEGSRLVTLRRKTVDGVDSMVVEGTGSSSYRQLEFTSKFSLGKSRSLFAAYTRSFSRSTLSDASSYLGNLPQPLIRDAYQTNSSGNVPNRILVWGEFALPWKFRVSPLVEQHTGFPYAVRDASQNYVGTPLSSQTRYPMFFSFDTSVSKDIQMTKKYAVQFTVRGLNLTNHFNPLAVHANTGDPQFGRLFGNYSRRFRLDFDVLF